MVKKKTTVKNQKKATPKKVMVKKKLKRGWWTPCAYDLLPKMPELFSSARFNLILEKDYGVKVDKQSISAWLHNLKKKGVVVNNIKGGQTWSYIGLQNLKQEILISTDTNWDEVIDNEKEPDPVSDLFRIDQLEDENLKLQYKVEEQEKNNTVLNEVIVSSKRYIEKMEAKLEIYKELLTEEMKK